MERKNAWEKYPEGKKRKEVFQFAEDYRKFISECKTERECTTEFAKRAEEADWKHHAQFFCKTYSHCHSFTLLHSSCIAVKIISALLAEIFPLKKFRQ